MSDNIVHYDVLIVGSGNAACSAAHAAIEKKARVGILEKASKGNRGGNSALTGHMRFVFKDRKSTCLNSSHIPLSRMPSSA